MAQTGPMQLTVVGKEPLAFPLNKPICLIGRDPDNDLVLNSPTVSRHHARIFLSQEGWRIRDLQSRNGLFANGVKHEEVLLAPGDVIKLGDVALRLEPSPDPNEEDSD